MELKMGKLALQISLIMALAGCGGGGGGGTGGGTTGGTTLGSPTTTAVLALTLDTAIASTSVASRTAVTTANGASGNEAILIFTYTNTGTTDLIVGSVTIRQPNLGSLFTDAQTTAAATKLCGGADSAAATLKSGESCQYPLKWSTAAVTATNVATVVPVDIDVKAPVFFFGAAPGGGLLSNTTADATFYYRFQ